MRKVLTLAILGTALVASVGARAETAPAFIGATACEAAAPLRTDARTTHRAVSARGGEAVSARGTVRARGADRAAGTARAEQRHATRPAQRSAEARSAEARADQAAPEVPGSVDEAPALRRAVHFCVGTPGARRVWMT